MVMMIIVTCCFEMKRRTLIGPFLVSTDSDALIYGLVRTSSSPVDCLLSLRSIMFCTLWLLFQTLAVVVEGGATSGSAEALANGGVNNNGRAAAGNNANNGAQNGVPLNGEPLLAQLVQLGGSFFIQPVGNQIGQVPLQQLIPIGAFQSAGALLPMQAGGANVNPQGQVAQAARGGPVTLFAVLSQRNAGGDPQGAVMTPGQVQLVPRAGLNYQQQLGAAGGNAAGRGRFLRSVAARLRGTQSAARKVMADEDDEDCSGMEVEEKQTK